jgi:hypothetical protein
MTYSSQDTDLYRKGVEDFAHLVKTWGAKEVVADLQQFFPDQYEELMTAMARKSVYKRLAALLDAPKV